MVYAACSNGKATRNIAKQLSSFLLILIVILFTISLASCGLGEQSLPKMQFEFTLTQQEVADALDVAAQLDSYIDNGKSAKIISTTKQLLKELDYLLHQYRVGEIKYYSDLENGDAYTMYVFSEEAYMAVREECLRVLKKLYHSDLLAKTIIFADWSDKEINMLEASSPEIIALEKEQNELMREYLTLDASDVDAWSNALEEINYQFVDSAQQLADFYGYDNYYDYAAKEIYTRDYSKEQREAFRKHVKENILPFYIEMQTLYREKRAALTAEQKALLSSLRNDSCTPSNEYLTGYIASYPKTMETVMNRLFSRNALVYSQSENAYVAAFTDFSHYYNQPYVFLGNDCQNLLTLVHELGHYSAFYHFTDATLPYDTCEVHSQGNEWMIMNYLDGIIESEVYEVFLLWRLSLGLENIVLCTFIDEYEETVYTQAELSSPQAFETILTQVLAGYQGIEQMASAEDIYIYAQQVTMESPVYYLSYATSELAAMSFYTVAEEDGYETAQEIYINLCLKTPTDNTFFDTLADVGLPDPFALDTVTKLKNTFNAVFADKAA